MNDFTLFPSFDSDDTFLELINYAEDCKSGDRLCDILIRCSKVFVTERKKHNYSLKGNADNFDESSQDGDRDDMRICSDAGAILSNIADSAMDESDSSSSNIPSRRQHKLGWKPEFLVCYACVKCNIWIRRIGMLFVIGAALVHDVVHAWETVLCLVLKKFFPELNRHQIIRACPKIILKKFGHTNIFILLDDTEAHS